MEVRQQSLCDVGGCISWERVPTLTSQRRVWEQGGRWGVEAGVKGDDTFWLKEAFAKVTAVKPCNGWLGNMRRPWNQQNGGQILNSHLWIWRASCLVEGWEASIYPTCLELVLWSQTDLGKVPPLSFTNYWLCTSYLTISGSLAVIAILVSTPWRWVWDQMGQGRKNT